MDVLTKEQRRKNMKAIKSRDSKIELIMRRALWEKGYRYRKNYKELPGKPDIALTKYKIAVFCDSEYFHGKDWPHLKQRIKKGNNSVFWEKKISGNIKHDRDVDIRLKDMGWTVLRFWGEDIKKHTDDCVRAVEDAVFDKKIETEDR